MSPHDGSASLYDWWLKALPGIFSVVTPQPMSGIFSGMSPQGLPGIFSAMAPYGMSGVAAGAPPFLKDGAGATVSTMLQAIGTAQQIFNALYMNYAQALSTAGNGAQPGAGGVAGSIAAIPAAFPFGTAMGAMAGLPGTVSRLLATSLANPAASPSLAMPLMSGLGQAFTALADALGLSPTRSLRDNLRELVTAIAARKAIEVEFIVFLGGAAGSMSHKITGRLQQMSAKSENFQSILEFVRMMVSMGDQAFHEAMQSEKGVELTARYIRATTQVRLQRTKLIDIVSEMCGVPSRSEIDEVHREIHELKRMLRRQKRAAEATSLPAVRAPARKAKTRRNSASKEALQ